VQAGGVTADDELIDLLEAFSAAFAAQDAAAIKALFVDDDVCFIASDSLVLHDRAHLVRFLDDYAAQPVSYSFEWDACQVSGGGEAGWVSAFGRQVRHDGDGVTKDAFRLTLACHRGADGWRIAHLHGSEPAA
jgi:ketosteroid isomerase-like protein